MLEEPVPAPSAGELVRLEGPGLPALPDVTLHDLYAALLADATNDLTRRARAHDCEVFRRFLGAPDAAAALVAFLAGGRGKANAIGAAFIAWQIERGVSPSTINRANASLRKAVKLAQRFDVIDWAVDLDDLRNDHASDRRGPGLDGWRALWQAAVHCGSGPIAKRDRALLRLLHDEALRKSEATNLDYPDDFDPGRPAVHIKGKARQGKEWVTINAPTLRALLEWLEARGDWPGPLFVARPCGGRSEREMAGRLANPDVFALRRIGERSVNAMLHGLARRAGLSQPCRPHGLRHQAITRALDLTGGDIRRVAKFARHSDVKVTLLYDDARQDLAGQVARLLGDDESPDRT